MANEYETYDLIIIGGGISGASVLREAANKGLKSLLIEKNDFSSGTSSKSAKLIHGGLRYLQHLQFKIVRESLVERNWLLESHPHLVKPIEFVMPFYGTSLKYRIAMILYQMLGKHKTLPKYKFYNKKQTIDKFAEINTKNLKGSFSYYDGITNDAKLVSEIIFEAEQYADIKAINYIEAIKIEDKDNVCYVHCKNTITEETIIYKSKVAVNCTGPWADNTLARYQPQSSHIMEPSKGVHLGLPLEKLPIKAAFAFPSGANDGRMLYALPWENDTVILGPTDTTFDGDFDHLSSNKIDIQYLLHGLNLFAPHAHFTANDILYSFVGLRPLFNEKGESKDKTRDFKIWWSSEDIVSLSGGKLTTFRAMGKAAIDKIISKKHLHTTLPTHPFSKPNSRISTLPKHIKEDYSLIAQEKILEILNEDSQNKEQIIDELKVIKGEIIFAIKYLHAKKIEDIMLRRFSFDYGLQHKKYYNKLKENIELILKNTL
ncbi:MAG TPA: glycerol-3-phosphate dehydrogenase/oxidase [Chitinophagales bacterium]|nr:glycerol-3-phosphate dehydrogenase/oxidase [Chitinophagales bacterium]